MQTPTHLIEKAAWLFFAAFWGLAVGLFILVFTLSPPAYGGDLSFVHVLPLVVVAISFPLIGAICDRLDSHHLFVTLLTLLITLLFLLDLTTGFRLQTPLLLTLALPNLMLGFFAPLTTYGHATFRNALKKSSRYFITWSSALLGMILLQQAFADISAFINFYYTLLIFCGSTACVLFLLQSKFVWGHVHHPLSNILKEEFKKNLSKDPYTHNFRILIAATLLFVAGSWNATRIAMESWRDVTLQTSYFMLPLILLTIIFTSAYTPKLVKSFGPKRHFTAMTIQVLLLSCAQMLATNSVEHYILLLLNLSVLSSNLINIFSLANWLLPPERVGQGTAWIAWSIVLGYGLAEGIHDLPRLLNTISLVIVLVISGISIQYFCKIRSESGTAETDEGTLGHRGGPLLTWPADGYIPHTNAQHNFLTSMLQSLARLTAELFFARIRIVGSANLQVKGGAILVANHPNTFLDPMLITALSPGRLHYWAKSTLWRLPFLGSVLDRLGAIPVYRRQDQQASHAANGNQQSLAIAADKLQNGGWILIFPEGGSEPGLSLKPLKTGAARLGLQTLDQSSHGLDVPIIPIGIDYMEPGIFRSNITLRIGQPLSLASYAEDYKEDPKQTVRHVTQELSNRMKHLLPHLNETNLESLVMRIYHLYGERVLEILECSDSTEARRKIAQAVNHYQQLDADTVRLFSQRLETYWQEYERLGTPENHDPISVFELLKIFAQLHTFAGFGLLTNWVPYKLTGRCVELLTPGQVWLATAKLSIGFVIFSLYYAILFMLTGTITTPLLGLVITLLVMTAGILSLGAMDRFAFRLHQFKTLWQAFWTQDTNENIDEMRISLIQDLERFRETYAFYSDNQDLNHDLFPVVEPQHTEPEQPETNPDDDSKGTSANQDEVAAVHESKDSSTETVSPEQETRKTPVEPQPSVQDKPQKETFINAEPNAQSNSDQETTKGANTCKTDSKSS